MRALALWTANFIDVSQHHPDEERKQYADDMVALLTPIIKSYCTERGFENVSEYAGLWWFRIYNRVVHRAVPARPSHRHDLRGNKSHQALDLVGRKLPRAGGRLYRQFSKKFIAL